MLQSFRRLAAPYRIGIAVGLAVALALPATIAFAGLIGLLNSPSNSFATTSLYSPTGLTVTRTGSSLALSWTAPASMHGNGYAISYVDNGSSTTCPTTVASYTFLAGSSTTSYTDTTSTLTTTASSYGCYLVQTGYNPAGAPPWAAAPVWTSLDVTTTVLAQLQILKKQFGTLAGPGGLPLVATIPATTAGDLLVASLEADSGCTTFTAPVGWTRAQTVRNTTVGILDEIWYRANAPSTTSVSFSCTGGVNAEGILSEWSGAGTSSQPDKTGTVVATTKALTATVTATAVNANKYDLGITTFGMSAGATTLTPSAGWTDIYNNPTNQFVTDYQLGEGTTTAATETMTAGVKQTWVGAIATFHR